MARTTKDIVGDGYTTHGKDGTTYRTTKDIIGDGYTTHRNDGATYRTTKDIVGDGYTTHRNDGTKYRTTKDIIGDGYTTHGMDGSTYKTRKPLFGEGYITNKISSPYYSSSAASSEGAGGGIGVLFLFMILVGVCAGILTLKSYIWIAVVIIAPLLSGVCEKFNISRIWCSGVVFCYAAFSLINSVFNDVSVVAYTQQGLLGLMVILILFVILLLGIFFTIFGLGESGFSFFVVLILLVSIAWCYLDGIHHIPQTQKMIPYAIGSLTVIAIIDQIICIVQYQKRRTYISGNYRNPTARTWGKSKLLFIFIITALILFVLLKTQIGTEMKDSLIKSLGNTSFTSNFGSDEYQEDDLENLVLYIDDYDNFNIDTDSYYEISNEDIVSASTSLNAHTVDKIFDNDPETNWQEGEEGAGIGEYFDISFENEREIGGLGFALA